MHELLLVEDDDALGRGIRLALEGGGLRVTVCPPWRRAAGPWRTGPSTC